jgi:hypothetical protein
MTYELAKQLKNAGFPKENFQTCEGGEKCNLGIEPHYFDAPTLPELIEACGDRLEELSKTTHKGKSDQKWGAYAYQCEQCEYTKSYSGYGSTPEEAVAKLWLALNK